MQKKPQKRTPSKNKDLQKTQAEQFVPELPKESFFPPLFQKFSFQLIFLAIIGFVFYANSIGNEYAFDDEIIITKNQYVQDGLKGIPAIFSHDAFDSYFGQMKENAQLTGGRYRPLSIATFAVEQQLFGDAPHVRHFVNVLLYVLTIISLFWLVRRYLLKAHPEIAFLAVFLFAIHPIHTEVVSNIKSRDELFSLLFISLTFIFAFRWRENRKTGTLILAMLWYFLALLSKEWGITLVFLLPVSYYIFLKEKTSKSFLYSVPFFLLAFVFVIIRFGVIKQFTQEVDKEILNNPYLLATPVQAVATKMFILLKYIGLLFFPYPLSADYSYNVIPYHGAGDIWVWISLVIYTVMIAGAVILTRKRDFLGFAFWFFLVNIFIVSNFMFPLGGMMGERLVFHSSLGFCIVIAWLLVFLLHDYVPRKRQGMLLLAFLVPVTCLAGFKTIQRNREWKNDYTLFTRDAAYTPNSTANNLNAGKNYVKRFEANPDHLDSVQQYALLDTAAVYLHRSVKIYPKNYLAYIDLGIIEAVRKNYEGTEYFWNLADNVFPRWKHPGFWAPYNDAIGKTLYSIGMSLAGKEDYDSSLSYFQRATKYSPDSSRYWYNLGVVSFKLGNYPAAKHAWETTLKLNPGNSEAQKGYQYVKSVPYEPAGD